MDDFSHDGWIGNTTDRVVKITQNSYFSYDGARAVAATFLENGLLSSASIKHRLPNTNQRKSAVPDSCWVAFVG
jgi:hypothetical protein